MRGGAARRGGPPSRRSNSRLEQAVALAGARPQAMTVEDGDDAAAVADQAGALQAARCRRYAGALHAQHHGEELLGQQELVGLHAVVRHQHPAAAALLQGMEVVARRRLRDLVEQRMGVAQHHHPHRGALRQLGAEPRRRHAQAGCREPGRRHWSARDRRPAAAAGRPRPRCRWCRPRRPGRWPWCSPASPRRFR